MAVLPVLPNLPKEVLAGNIVYTLTLVRIVSRDEDNRPEEALIIPPDRYVEPTSGDEYMAVYIPKTLMEKH